MNPAVTSISAFFPCYNDEPTILRMVEGALAALDRVGVDGEVIVVNDGSTDGSSKILHDLALEEPRLRVIDHETNRGYGGALLSGFAAATRQWVFYTDGDAQYDPGELEQFVLRATDDVDVVQGYKILRADNLVRRIIGRVYHRFVALMFGLKIRDTDCDFRLIRRSTLERVHLVHTTGVVCVEMVRKLEDSVSSSCRCTTTRVPTVSRSSSALAACCDRCATSQSCGWGSSYFTAPTRSTRSVARCHHDR